MRGYRKEKRRPLASFFACGSLSADPFPAACPTPWERFQPRAFPVFERDQKLAAEAAPTKVGAEPPTPSPASSDEHTSELQLLMPISHAVFSLTQKKPEYYSAPTVRTATGVTLHIQ